MLQPSEPLQERSRETLERILATAAEAATENGFDAVSIREICNRSGVTTGAFYARFQKKDDLAFVLLDSLSDEFRSVIDDHLALRESIGLVASIPVLLSSTALLYRRRAGLLHALITKAGSSRELAKAMRKLNDEIFTQLVAPPYAVEIRHPEPALGLRLGFLCVFTALKELVLDQRLIDEPLSVDDELLVAELSQIFLRYVTDERR